MFVDKHPNQPTSRVLFDLSRKYNTGKYSCGYIDPYDWHFNHLRDQPIKFIEFGVLAGASFQMWADYFSQGKVYGVDQTPPTACGMSLDNGRAEIILGNLDLPEFHNQLIAQTGGQFDIIMDDASHYMEQQQLLFRSFFPHLKPGGIYALEDLHTSYWPQFHGGWKTPGSTIEFLKELVDAPSMDAWREARCTNQPTTQLFEGQIHSIHFYLGLCLIYKRP